MKVYIVTSGEYSDYGIDRVFLAESLAHRWVDLHQKPNCYGEPDSHYRVEEYEVTEAMPEVTTIYTRRVLISKRTAHITSDDSSSSVYEMVGLSREPEEIIRRGLVVERRESTNPRINVPWITIWVRGTDKEKVDKVAQDHVAKERAQLLAL